MIYNIYLTEKLEDRIESLLYLKHYIIQNNWLVIFELKGKI